MTEAERWARIVIFILVGGYAVLVLILTIRFVIRSCFSQRDSDSGNRWDQFLAENGRRLTGEAPPPKFDEALSMKVPISVVEVDETLPPSYEEYVRRYSTDSMSIMKSSHHLLENNNEDNHNTCTNIAIQKENNEEMDCHIISSNCNINNNIAELHQNHNQTLHHNCSIIFEEETPAQKEQCES